LVSRKAEGQQSAVKRRVNAEGQLLVSKNQDPRSNIEIGVTVFADELSVFGFGTNEQKES